jgi:hypothetical protein
MLDISENFLGFTHKNRGGALWPHLDFVTD